MRIGIAGGDGEEIIAVGERIGRLDTRRLRGLCGDDAKRHARTVDGERCGNHSFLGYHFAAAQARRSSEGVAELTVAGPVAAELIVGIAHGGQIDDRAADIADGHVGVAGRKSVADHGDDPVVAKNVVAEDPIGFLTGGGSRGACRRRLPQRRRFQQFRRDRDDLRSRSRCHRQPSGRKHQRQDDRRRQATHRSRLRWDLGTGWPANPIAPGRVADRFHQSLTGLPAEPAAAPVAPASGPTRLRHIRAADAQAIPATPA